MNVQSIDPTLAALLSEQARLEDAIDLLEIDPDDPTYHHELSYLRDKLDMIGGMITAYIGGAWHG